MDHVKDPWRVETGATTTAPKTARGKGKINLSDIDLDEDLRIPGVYAFECRYGSIEVKDVRVSSPSAALDLLASCIATLYKQGTKMSDGIVVRFGKPQKGIEGGAWLWTAPDYPYPAGINFSNVDYETGMVNLIRWLNSVKKMKPKLLKQFGVSTRLR